MDRNKNSGIGVSPVRPKIPSKQKLTGETPVPVPSDTSRERMEAIIETLEIMGNPKAMKALRNYEAGKGKFKDVSCLDEN
jgi:hypothetical protein